MKKLKIHFLGIGGISQSAIALILKSQGYFVSGSDRVRSRMVENLIAAQIPVCVNGISPDIEDADLIVVSAAIHPDDPEYALCEKLGKKIISRAKMLGILSREYQNVISIAGSHGKTTTTAMVAEIFIRAGLDPTVHVGGETIDIGGNVRIGGKKYFITEACEYVDSFLELKSDVSVILNIQSDHLDYFKTFENINRSFGKFAAHTKDGGLVVYLGDDENANKRYEQKSISFSISGHGVLEARNIKEYVKGKYKFDLYMLGTKLIKVRLGVYGHHNVYNALASIAVALNYGIDIGTIKDAIYHFGGVKRRFEECGTYHKAKIITDYAHHPTEIKATIELARRVTQGKLFVVFQPHTYSRTKTLLPDFLTCFSGSKEVLVYKVYAARETPDQGMDEKELARRLSLAGQKAFSFDDYNEMKEYLNSRIAPGDTILVLGAGDIVEFCETLK